MKKVYTAAFKAQVALDLLKEEKTLAQISAEYGVHANVLRDWRTQALKGLPTIFDRRDDIAALKTTHTQQVDELYAEIGRLTTQLTWLKKTVRAMATYVQAIASYRSICYTEARTGCRLFARRSVCVAPSSTPT